MTLSNGHIARIVPPEQAERWRRRGFAEASGAGDGAKAPASARSARAHSAGESRERPAPAGREKPAAPQGGTP